MKKKGYFLVLLTGMWVLSCTWVFPQEKDTLPDYALAFVPQYIFQRGIEIDLDRRLDERNWLMIGPQFYADYKGDERLFGLGLDLMNKRFFQPVGPPMGLYLGYGSVFRYYKASYMGEGQHSVVREGLTYIEYGEYRVREEIVKTGLNAVIGLQGKFIDNLMLDLYFGFGFRYSFFLDGNFDDSRFTAEFIGLGYRGNLLVGGARLLMIL